MNISDFKNKPFSFDFLPFGLKPEDGVSSVEVAAGLIAGRAKAGSVGVKVAFSTRLDMETMHFLEICAKRADVSKNEMLNFIVQAGMQAIYENMNEDEKKSLISEYSNTYFKSNNLVNDWLDSFMFLLQGKLINIFETPKGKTKDGENYGGEDRIQIMHETTLKNGEKRVDLVDLTVDDIEPYRNKLNSAVSVPVAVSVWQGKLSVKAA